METPREIMFRAFTEWGIKNNELAKLILKKESVTTSKAPIDHIATRSSLSRFVVHVKPGEHVHGQFEPFEECVPRVVARLKRRFPSPSDNQLIICDLERIASDMRSSLDSHGLDGAIYLNAQEKLSNLIEISAADAVELSVMLLVVTGCTGDPHEAVNTTMAQANRYVGLSALSTALPQAVQSPLQASLELGIYRCQDGILLSNPYRLATDPDGTEIGALSTAEHSINDVGYGVSRRHARIWRDSEGIWWIEGLGSTNGTVHVSGLDGTETVVEPPRKGNGGLASRPVRIQSGDRLILAKSTEFTVVELPQTQ